MMDIYDIILISAVIGITGLFIYLLYMALKQMRARKKARTMQAVKATTSPKLVITSSDISAIAGDDVIATQLDLARAYIETGRFLLAKKILDHVRDHGNDVQQVEAQQLLSSI